MDMEVWLESLTAGMETVSETEPEPETETIEEDTADDQGESLPENTEENSSIVETMSMNKSVMRTASLSSTTSPTLLGENKTVVTMANTAAANNDEEYNVIFCVDTRGFAALKDQGETTDEQDFFTGIIEQTRNKLIYSNHKEKAHIYWFNENTYFGEMHNGIMSDSNFKNNVTRPIGVNDVYREEIDIAEIALSALSLNKHIDKLHTYVFLVFNSANLDSESTPALELNEKVKTNDKLHMSIITNLDTYEDTGYIIKMVNNSGGTIINTNNADAKTEAMVGTAVVKFLRATEQPIKIISSVGLTPLSPKFDSKYIKNLNQPQNQIIDTDFDDLPDYKEIALDSGLIDFAQEDYLPTVQDCIDYLEKTGNYTYVESGYDEFWSGQEDKYSTDVFGTSFAAIIKGIRILPINSDPTMKDSDNDGLIDGETKIQVFEHNGDIISDSAPLVRGVFDIDGKTIISGNLTIISCSDFPAGHAFLLYKSYINDSIDFTGFAYGYDFNSTTLRTPSTDYRLLPNSYVAIGNAGGTAAGFEADGGEIFENISQLNDNDIGGMYYNRELALVLVKYNEFLSTKNATWDDPYGENESFSKGLPINSLYDIVKISREHDWYNLIYHNCVFTATICWNYVFPHDIFPNLCTPTHLKELIRNIDGAFKIDILHEVLKK
jgi:hypothetical protein